MAAKRITAGIILTVILLCISTATYSTTDELLKDEMGLTRLQVIYPENGAAIEETRPMIGADASMLEIPIDTQTVVITLNGIDVTDNSEITPGYIIYKPLEPLASRKYEVRITAKNINKENIEPLSWSFNIKGELPEEIIEREKDNTTGRFVVSTDYVGAEYAPREQIDVSQIFREKEGMKLNTDLFFTNVSSGRTIIGSYHRETQSYTDMELDKARLDYYDSNFSASLGNFWLSLSDFSLLGAELAGAKIEKEIGPWGITLFSGRTQDPGTSGRFKQLASGARGDYEWDKHHTSSITAIAANEKDAGASSIAPLPARDEIMSFEHQYQYDERTSASLEIARNNRSERGDIASHDSAARISVAMTRDAFSGEIYAYDIGEDFYPVSEGSAKYLKNDRRGAMGKGAWQVTDNLKVGGEYEQYDTNSTDTRTKRGNAFVTVSYGMLQSVQYRKAKLVSSGTVSKTDSLNAVLLIPSTSNFTETRLTAGAHKIDYSGAGILVETDVILFALNTSYRDRLGLSASYSNSDTDNITSISNTENKNFSLGLNWNIIPFKLMWSGRYENIRNSGSSVDNEEERVKTAVKYILNNTYAFNLGWDTITYSDTISNGYNYDQSIFRSGVEWEF
ncbi:MAG TPA: hypothetical protein PLN69_08950 [bacterium]|nr:hypothetical protein [bacterium]